MVGFLARRDPLFFCPGDRINHTDIAIQGIEDKNRVLQLGMDSEDMETANSQN